MQDLSLPFYFRSFHWQKNKNPLHIAPHAQFAMQIPEPWLLHHVGSKAPQPCCFPSAASPSRPPQQCERLHTPLEDAFHLRPFPRAGPAVGGWHSDAKLLYSPAGNVVGAWPSGGVAHRALSLDLKV